MIERILKLFMGRASVSERVLEASVDTLAKTLEEKGIPEVPHVVRAAIAQEALRKAARKEADSIARMGEFLSQLDEAADNVVAAMNGRPADDRIRGILSFHKILPEDERLAE